MKRSLTAISALLVLTACGDGQPFFDIDTEGDVPDVDIALDGTENAVASRSIIRIEPGDENGNANEQGGGLVRSATFNEEDNTYTIDNLAFDGENVYEPDSVFPTLGGYAIYAADETVPDFLTGAPVGQIVPYLAITGRSAVIIPEGLDGEGQPRATFAIVRSGGYVPFGFGGFVYERNGDVVLAESGQAQWEGTYAGIRTFDPSSEITELAGLTGSEYTTGDVVISFDFDDFNTNNGVVGVIDQRRAFDANGVAIPINTGDGQPLLPALEFVVEQGLDVLLESGELSGTLNNTRINSNGGLEIYEEGTYYGILAGDTTTDDGGELVGVFVVESDDPRVNDLRAQETGGFILQRATP